MYTHTYKLRCNGADCERRIQCYRYVNRQDDGTIMMPSMCNRRGDGVLLTDAFWPRSEPLPPEDPHGTE